MNTKYQMLNRTVWTDVTTGQLLVDAVLGGIMMDVIYPIDCNCCYL